MGCTGNHFGSAALFHNGIGGIAQGAGSIDHIVYQNYFFAAHITDDIHHFAHIGFLAAFIAAIGRHGCTMDELLAVFNRYGDRVHVEELHNGEFDWLISFEDGQPDAYRYCIADEGCHLTYHRFTKEDYEAFGF